MALRHVNEKLPPPLVQARRQALSINGFAPAYRVVTVAKLGGHLDTMNGYVSWSKDSMNIRILDTKQPTGGASLTKQFPRSRRVTQSGTGDGASQ